MPVWCQRRRVRPGRPAVAVQRHRQSAADNGAHGAAGAADGLDERHRRARARGREREERVGACTGRRAPAARDAAARDAGAAAPRLGGLLRDVVPRPRAAADSARVTLALCEVGAQGKCVVEGRIDWPEPNALAAEIRLGPHAYDRSYNQLFIAAGGCNVSISGGGGDELLLLAEVVGANASGACEKLALVPVGATTWWRANKVTSDGATTLSFESYGLGTIDVRDAVRRRGCAAAAAGGGPAAPCVPAGAGRAHRAEHGGSTPRRHRPEARRGAHARARIVRSVRRSRGGEAGGADGDDVADSVEPARGGAVRAGDPRQPVGARQGRDERRVGVRDVRLGQPLWELHAVARREGARLLGADPGDQVEDGQGLRRQRRDVRQQGEALAAAGRRQSAPRDAPAVQRELDRRAPPRRSDRLERLV